ncbi:MAG: extracellular solute-binding protein, partial [Ruminococcus sp.]|nr:extracellular solute-binding protein [Ruminococcus sp.]
MKKRIAMLLCAAMAVSLFTGCSSGGDSAKPKEDTAGSGDSEEQTAEAEEISIWHDGDEAIMEVIESQVNEKLSGDGVTVKFEKKSGLTDQIKLYGNDGESGPDMYMYAHDSLGTFVEMGVLSPLSDIAGEEVYADMLPMTQEAGLYKGEQYLLPVYFETLLFMYNKDLWEGEVPSTTEELYTYMEAHTDAAAGTYALVNQHST